MPAANLVELADQKTFLGITVGTDDALLQQLINNVKALFERACNRGERPFQDTQTGWIERLDGTGSTTLIVSYPIASVTSLKLGYDPAAPNETLDPTLKNVVAWQAGSVRIVRVDGSKWGHYGDPLWVQVTYDTQADLPKDAAMAVMAGVALLYRRRGSEDALIERLGAYSTDLARLDQLEEWRAAVANHWQWRGQ